MLLDDISGEACVGKLLVVMGASGYGKSMLVDILAGWIARESLHDSVTLNNEPLQGRRRGPPRCVGRGVPVRVDRDRHQGITHEGVTPARRRRRSARLIHRLGNRRLPSEDL
jgi:ABC-type taurine transport system ATPase subunit